MPHVRLSILCDRTLQLLAAASGWCLLAQPAIAHPNHADPSLVSLLAHDSLTASWVMAALGGATVLGAAHALSPGHGKTLAAAYLVGDRSTPHHAILLGVTTTLTHTLAVFGLGAIALVATQFGWAEQITPMLGLVSGALVFGLGLYLLYQRLQTLDHAHTHPHDHSHTHAHDHGHAHDHHHAHSPRGVVALGIAGGLVPCPSALVLLLSAIALHQTLFGLALVTAFSLGLSLVLVGLGLGVVYSREWLGHHFGHWFETQPNVRSMLRYLPVVSALVIMVVGAVLTTQAIV